MPVSDITVLFFVDVINFAVSDTRNDNNNMTGCKANINIWKKKIVQYETRPSVRARSLFVFARSGINVDLEPRRQRIAECSRAKPI